MNTLNLPNKLAFIDTETTGLKPGKSRIIDIGIILVEDSKVIDTFESLVNPLEPVSSFIQQYTGISQSELDFAPSFRQIHEQILSLLADYTLVAHNASFDIGMLQGEFNFLKMPWQQPYFCTVRLSRLL